MGRFLGRGGFARRVERGTVWFGILFLLLPALLFVVALALKSAWSVLSVLVGLGLLFVGFTLVVGAMSV